MYYEYDGLGTVTALRNRHGDTIEDYRYDAFGNLQTGITSPYNLKGYTGHLYDDKSSLVFMNARWYNPSVGRFMSEDTYRGDPATPQSLNQYAYVMNNPVNFVDPTGNIPLYSRDYLESKTRSQLVSLEAKMGEYWWEDYDEFIETGVWTEKQNIAHANAELIREVRPYIFEKIDHYESWSGWDLEGKKEYPYHIVYTYGATKTIADVYQNDFETKTDKTYEYYTQTRVETAAEVAANNQSSIESDYGVVNSDWNNNPSMKLVRTVHMTIHNYDNTLVNSTQTVNSDTNHTNVNKDVLIGEIGKGRVVWGDDGSINENPEKSMSNATFVLALGQDKTSRQLSGMIILLGVTSILLQNVSIPEFDFANHRVFTADVVDYETVVEGEVNGIPNQGTVKGNVDGAPPVDAGKQGKHVPGHNNNDSSKSQWPQGQDGIDLTQQGWQNGETLPDGTIVWNTGNPIGPNGETGVRVHIDGKGNIHGYPVNPSQYLP